MAISVTCSCGHHYYVHDLCAGQQRKCLYCGAYYTVPGEENPAEDLEPEPSFSFEREPMPADATREDMASRAAEARASYGAPPLNPALTFVQRPEWSRRYWILLLALIPLVASSFKKDDFDEKKKITESIEALTEAEQRDFGSALRKYRPEELTFNNVIDALPQHKLLGALLPLNTWTHWIFALLSAIAFLVVIALFFPSNTTSIAALIVTGVFTGTAGILLLLGVQWVALNMSGFPRGGGAIALIFLILKLIGLSYVMALSSDYGFWTSLLGFTFGVGLCEEVCKALPVFHHFVSAGKKMDWRGACAWGLASGVGFGVSEGITYSSSYYNGILGGDIYLIRFISCVALHAIWSAAAGLSIWKRREDLNAPDMSYWELFFRLVWITIVPMFLHGFYDTLLKKELNGLAVVAALLSFGYFAWKVEDAKRYERELEPNVVTA